MRRALAVVWPRVLPSSMRRAFFISPFSGALPSASVFDAPVYYREGRAPAVAGRAMAPHVQDDEAAVHLELEVPRFKPDDISVKADAVRGVLTITGKRRQVAGGPVVEAFERSFSAPADRFDLNTVKTSVEHGVATVTIQKKLSPPTAPAADDVLMSSAAYDDAAKMQWPPKFDTADSANELVYTATVPTNFSADNVDVHLTRAGSLAVTVRAHVENVKKDGSGRVVFSESRALQYTSNLPAPKGTQPNDVNVALTAGLLRVAIAKRGAGTPVGQTINVQQR